ncbi:HNH endonuclease [Bacteroides ovatus]|uniref:HNH endonuclease n=1 Tax=Bacteroides ovatus TaxID=28116 RepID=UPI00321A107A
MKILLNTVETKNNFIINEDDYKSEIEERVEYYRKLIIQEQEEQERLFIESEKEKIKQQILEKQRKKELRKKAIEELREEGLIERIKKREPIPQDIQDAVWRRDNGRCVKCGSQENLEFDHIIPFSKGGSNSIRNLQLLCEKCNREKSNHIG